MNQVQPHPRRERQVATKWLELLREVAPLVKRLVILMEPESSDFYIRALKPAASSLGVELKELRVITGGDAELERTIAAFAATPNSIQPSSSWSSI
jgi:ABC-type uncharacterized transport system substrate-binding protein